MKGTITLGQYEEIVREICRSHIKRCMIADENISNSRLNTPLKVKEVYAEHHMLLKIALKKFNKDMLLNESCVRKALYEY